MPIFKGCGLPLAAPNARADLRRFFHARGRLTALSLRTLRMGGVLNGHDRRNMEAPDG